MKEIRYETPIDQVDWTLPSIFLAGPTVRGFQTHLKSWRPEAAALLKAKGFEGNVIIPEFECPTESDKYRFDVPVWEFGGLQKSNVILFWLPRTKELIGFTTNYELGYWVARERGKIVYGRPDDAYRVTYCDIMWVEDCKRRGLRTTHATIYNTLEKTVDAALEKLK